MAASEALGASRMTKTRQSAVTVAESGSGPYSQLVHAGRHVLSADEPEASGGHDVGPSPNNNFRPEPGPGPPLSCGPMADGINGGGGGRQAEWGMERIRARVGNRISTLFIPPILP